MFNQYHMTYEMQLLLPSLSASLLTLSLSLSLSLSPSLSLPPILLSLYPSLPLLTAVELFCL